MSEEIQDKEAIEVKVEPTPVVTVQVARAEPRPSVEITNGIVVTKTLDEAYRYATAIFKSGLAPKQLDSAEKVMVAMQTAQELGLPPLTALKSMYVVNGTVALFGDLPLALVQKSGLLEDIKETWYDEKGGQISNENLNIDELIFRAEVIVKRKNIPTPTVRTYSWKEVQAAGLDLNYGKEKITYKNFRKRMLQMRARSWALKDAFSDVLMGISISEYDTHGQERDVTIKPKSSLNELLSNRDNSTKDEMI